MMKVLQIGVWKKMGHAHNQCFHLKMKVLLVGFYFLFIDIFWIFLIAFGSLEACIAFGGEDAAKSMLDDYRTSFCNTCIIKTY
jgi:hypothetical protein